MMAEHRLQHQGIAGTVGGHDDALVRVVWVYDTKFPWSLKLIVHGRNPLMRLVSRDLLNRGVSVPTGDLDLWIRPEFFARPAQVRFLIHVVDGLTMQLDLNRDDLIELLDEAERLVPFGTEEKFQDWDGGLALCEGAA
ncbi:SsgA family sporulation/cell division regulator [Amycolatopsis sp. NPDC051373]|uniref:SsgA family sporulation/cell division regulator n=1 Tax=Amycolatopsis sp. NPDC051373 TaxID=3155801 RepID=UPI0034504ADA